MPMNTINFGVEIKRLFPDADTKPRRVKGQLARHWFGLRWRNMEVDEPTPIDWSGLEWFDKLVGVGPINVPPSRCTEYEWDGEDDVPDNGW
jgi:hypothetical protein